MDILEYIRENKDFNNLLMNECDIYFYEQIRETQFLENILLAVRHLHRMAAGVNLFSWRMAA